MGTVDTTNIFEKTGYQFVKVFLDGIEVKYCCSFNVEEGWVEHGAFDDNGDALVVNGEWVLLKRHGVVTYEEAG